MFNVLDLKNNCLDEDFPERNWELASPLKFKTADAVSYYPSFSCKGNKYMATINIILNYNFYIIES